MIRFDRVTFRYNEKSETSFALKEVSFSCSKNAVNGIIGANGCGKSTVLKLAAGLIRQESGIIEVDGCVDSFRNQQKKLITGIIFQNPDNQIVGTTVEEDLAFGLENLGVAPETMRERIASVADTFLEDRNNCCASHRSLLWNPHGSFLMNLLLILTHGPEKTSGIPLLFLSMRKDWE
jgi:energy-coupling factor transporter ATP-binding protein EcfA2